MLAGGGEACSDIERLRAQPRLFGAVRVGLDVVSHRSGRSTRPRWMVCGKRWPRRERRCGDDRRPRRAGRRWCWTSTRRWSRSTPRTRKAPPRTTSAGSGSHPMFCFADATGEALAGLLRPGNATANSIADQLAVLDAAIGQLPARIAAGHHVGDDPSIGASSGAGAGRLRRVQRPPRRRVPGPQHRVRGRGPHEPAGQSGDQPRRRRRDRWAPGAHPSRRRTATAPRSRSSPTSST